MILLAGLPVAGDSVGQSLPKQSTTKLFEWESLALWPGDADQPVTVSEAKKDANGFLIHEVRSPYQAGVTHIRVLLPDKLKEGKRYPVFYLLPVEAGKDSRY